MTTSNILQNHSKIEDIERLAHEVIGSAIEVHRELGPGLLESTYEECLAFELRQRGKKVEQQKSMPIIYKAKSLDCGYRLDLLVENLLIIEIKSVNYLAPIHQSQLLSYLKLSRRTLGLLINFNVPLLKHGIIRIINGN